jgi:hypothetical protein
MIDSIPAGWSSVETSFHQQEQAIQRASDGLVLSIEKNTGTKHKWNLVTLPENFRDDNQIIDHVDDHDSLDFIELQAMFFMLNPNK